MSSATESAHSGAGTLSLMSCVRESSPPQDVGNEYEIDKNVASKKKFWNPRTWFKRKPHKTPEDVTSSNEVLDQRETVRSRSASELSVNEEPTRRRSSNSINAVLSVSHDSVFPHSGSELELDAAKSTSSLSIHQQILPDQIKTELTERLRLRRGRGDTSEDDEGLPRSPCNSPTTADELLEKTAIKDLPTKSHSTCSDGSLLSMGSCDMDEDTLGQHSKNLLDKKNTDYGRYNDVTYGDDKLDLEFGTVTSSVPLSHLGAHHKKAVRPKKTHGAPRRRRNQQVNTSALPTTPEVNEDSSIRSSTPDVGSKESVTELCANKCMNKSQALTEIQIKCSSLPPGLAGPGSDGSKLSRSRSNAGSKSQDIFATLGEEEEDKKEKSDKSFLGRFFPRRSGRKKKCKEDKCHAPNGNNYTRQTIDDYSQSAKIIVSSKQPERNTINIDSNLSIRPNALVRSGPAARQRVQPIDIPASPELSVRRDENIILPKPSPEKSFAGTSPLQAELESHFRNKLASLSTSPPKSILPTPPTSPKLTKIVPSTPPKSPRIERTYYTKYSKLETTRESKLEDTKNKIKLPALTSLHQRILLLNDDTDNGPKSLETLPPKQPITKSHSFKSTKSSQDHVYIKSKNIKDEEDLNKIKTHNDSSNNITKSISLDSVNNHENKLSETIVKESKITINNLNFENRKSEIIHESKMYPITLKNSEIKIQKPNEINDLTSNNDTINLNDNKTEFAYESKVTSLESSTKISEESKIINKSDIEHFPMIKTEFDNVKMNTQDKNTESKIIDMIKESKMLLTECNNINLQSNIDQKSETTTQNSVTISGPSHTAIVSVGNINTDINHSQTYIENIHEELIKDDNFKELKIKEQQISVTKIKLKCETNQVSVKKNPDFLSVQLNKVETKPNTNIVLSTTPKIIDEQKKPKNVLDEDIKKSTSPTLECKRKFSTEDIEIIENDSNDNSINNNISTTFVTITPPPIASTRMFKKHSETQISQQRKSSLVCDSTNKTEKPILRAKSCSLEMTDNMKINNDDNNSDRLSQKSLDDLENKKKAKSDKITTDNVVLRRKILVKQKQEDEPELMKVFARRSLKLKDNESEEISQQVILTVEDSANMNKSRDSDKENQSDSPSEERKKINIFKETPKIKDSLTETKNVETAEVLFRKPINNKINSFQRAASLNMLKNNEIICNDKIQKQTSLIERPKTDGWNMKNDDTECKIKDDIINNRIDSDYINEETIKPKNVNQRKAEWEKRAQEAKKKTMP